MDKCPQCGAQQRAILEACPSCGHHLGFPNVIQAQCVEETEALQARLSSAIAAFNAAGLSTELSNLRDAISHKSQVVVTVSSNVALTLVNDEKNIYRSYEALVAGGIREPAAFANDAQRNLVAGILFGSYADKIVYGALSLSPIGLSTYGDLHLTLKNVAVRERTSFLECNSYDFVGSHPKGALPLGYRSDWAARSDLFACKLHAKGLVAKVAFSQDWSTLLLYCDGRNRQQDEFVEAHIYGGFNIYSVENIALSESLPKGRDRTLCETVIAIFNERKS